MRVLSLYDWSGAVEFLRRKVKAKVKGHEAPRRIVAELISPPSEQATN